MSNIIDQDKRLIDAIEVIRKHIEIIYPSMEDGDKQASLNAIDLIEMNTIMFSSVEERSGFMDFIGGFVECNYSESHHKLDWCKGYLRASNLNHVKKNQDGFDKWHFDNAKGVVNQVFTSNE
ncbi:MAG: hypothetical protein HRU38_23360 [Saccharospirillaceae bacterium]|nr:hypothetical protein [Saccharospirillaceae bacterium]